MDTVKSIDVLNSLIEVNNDRIEGYKTALTETHEADVRLLFEECAQTSQTCHRELSHEIRTLGGTPLVGTGVAGKFFRIWMDVKAAMTITDRRTVLHSCQYGDEMTIQSYEEVLAKHLEDLTISQQNMVRAQCVLIKADRDGVKNLRDMSPK
jgi:uncharacterized protein (TIGR02284 family)